MHPTQLGRVRRDRRRGRLRRAGAGARRRVARGGRDGQAPANAGAITKFVSTITDNALWLIGTIAVLAVVVIGGLFFFGHCRAADYAAKIAIGAVIIVSAPGIAA